MTWLKHATTVANRAALVPAPDGARTSVPMIILARDVLRRLDCLHLGVDSDDERVLTSINQFDFLAFVAALSAADGSLPGSAFYPHFATFYGHPDQPHRRAARR